MFLDYKSEGAGNPSYLISYCILTGIVIYNQTINDYFAVKY